MSQSLKHALLGGIFLLLAAILAMLVVLALRGVRIEHTGSVNLGGLEQGISLRMSEPMTLVMPEPARLVATGVDRDVIPVEFDILTCPEGAGTRLPVRWNPWTGEIEWACPGAEDGPGGPQTAP